MVFSVQLKDFFFSPAKIAEHLERSNEQVAGERILLQALEAERSRLVAEADKLYRLYQEEHISGRGFAERNAALEERLEQLGNEIPKLQANLDFLKIEFLSSEEALADAQVNRPGIAGGSKP